MTRSEINKNIIDGPILKSILVFFLPVLLGGLLQQLYNTVDVAIVGRFVGTKALAAVGGSAAVIFGATVRLFVGLSSGCAVRISQHFGSGKYEDMSKEIHTSMIFSLLCGIAFTVLGILFTPWIVCITKVPAETKALTISYLRIIFAGMVGNLVYNMGASVLRALGDSKRPFIYLAVSCILNIILDILFVVVIPWGVAGAALATIISQLISAILVIYALVNNEGYEKLIISKEKLTMSKKHLNGMLKIGIGAGLQSVMYSVSNIIVQVAINGLGTATVAAWAAYTKFDAFYWMFDEALAVSLTTFIGQNYGARRNDRVRKGMWVCMAISFAQVIAFCVFFILAGRFALGMFVADNEVIEIGVMIVHILAPALILWGPIDVFSSTLRGMGDAWSPMIITCVGVCIFRLIYIAVITSISYDIRTITMVYPISWGLTSIIYAIYFFGFSKWRKVQ